MLKEDRKCPLSLTEWLKANPDMAIKYPEHRGYIEELYHKQVEADRAWVEAKARRKKCP
jgi:hypothetical protein